MSEVFRVDPEASDPNRAAVLAAARAVREGGLLVLPTETVYGLGCAPGDPDATARLFRAKRRPPGLNLPVLVATEAEAWEVAAPTPAARALARAFWPGPITLVLPRTARSRGWALGEGAETVAVRIPRHRLALDLLEAAGPIAATSANISGEPPLEAEEDLVRTFGEAVRVYLVLPPGARPAGRPSAVVDCAGARLRVLRPGSLGRDDLRGALARAGLSGQPIDFAR